jgi:hypothetical protein
MLSITFEVPNVLRYSYPKGRTVWLVRASIVVFEIEVRAVPDQQDATTHHINASGVRPRAALCHTSSSAVLAHQRIAAKDCHWSISQAPGGHGRPRAGYQEVLGRGIRDLYNE